MTASEKPTRKIVRQTSSSWFVTKLRTTSTSEVQRWMISPVLCSTCHAYGSRWIWRYSASRSDLTKLSEPFAVPMRLP